MVLLFILSTTGRNPVYLHQIAIITCGRNSLANLRQLCLILLMLLLGSPFPLALPPPAPRALPPPLSPPCPRRGLSFLICLSVLYCVSTPEMVKVWSRGEFMETDDRLLNEGVFY